jgi:hypothetical protein
VAEGEGQHDQRRWYGVSNPCREAAGPTGAKKSESEGDLTARRTWYGLGEGHQFSEGLFVTPLAALDKLCMEITEMSDRATEGKAAETQKGGQDFSRSAGLRY